MVQNLQYYNSIKTILICLEVCLYLLLVCGNHFENSFNDVCILFVCRRVLKRKHRPEHDMFGRKISLRQKKTQKCFSIHWNVSWGRTTVFGQFVQR